MNEFSHFFRFNFFVSLHPFYGALPDNNVPDALTLQRFPHEPVSVDIIIELLLPEINPAFRRISVLASAVPMPVTAMNKDGNCIFWYIDIGMAEHTGVILPVAKTLVVQ